MPKVDLFASRLYHQLPHYFTWKPNLFSQGTKMPTTDLVQSIHLCVSLFCFVLQILKKVSSKQTEKMLLVTSTWQSQILYPLSTRNIYSLSTATSKEHKLENPTRASSSSNCKQKMRLKVWTISEKEYLTRVFQKQLPNLDYLAFFFEKGYEYRTIGCQRFAISALDDYVDGKPVGQHQKPVSNSVGFLTADHLSLDICL